MNLYRLIVSAENAYPNIIGLFLTIYEGDSRTIQRVRVSRVDDVPAPPIA